jgi:hypothetical protein
MLISDAIKTADTVYVSCKSPVAWNWILPDMHVCAADLEKD